MHAGEHVARIHAHELRVLLYAHARAEQRQRHRIERARGFDMPISVPRALAGLKERIGPVRERLQRGVLDLDEARY